MAYTLDIAVILGAGNAGLTLEAQLVNTSGANVGSAVTTGFTHIGNGNYLWHYAGFPDGHRGGVKFSISPGGALKAFVAVNPEEAENTDVKTSTRSSHTAADIWAVGTRTLTSFGTLVADVAAAVWAYTTRTLTVAVGEILAVLEGTTISIPRGDTIAVTVTGLGNISTRTKLYFTVKDSLVDADSDAILQIEEIAGLTRLNGAATTTTDGSLTVNNATTGDVTIALKPAASAQLSAPQNYRYDIQMVTASGVTTLTSGRFAVSADVTRAVT